MAAIEFALVALVLMAFLYGIATFGAVLYTQQVVARSAEDGARAVALLPVAALVDEGRVRAVVLDSLSQSLVAPPAHNATQQQRLNWLDQAVTVTVLTQGVAGQAGSRADVTVAYPYSQNRVLPTMPLLDTSRWMPDTLRSRATVALEQP